MSELPERYVRVQELVRTGVPVAKAIRQVGIGGGQYYKWRQKFNPERVKPRRARGAPPEPHQPFLAHIPVAEPPRQEPRPEKKQSNLTCLIGSAEDIAAVLSKGLK